jgi:hypothetical protein
LSEHAGLRLSLRLFGRPFTGVTFSAQGRTAGVHQLLARRRLPHVSQRTGLESHAPSATDPNERSRTRSVRRDSSGDLRGCDNPVETGIEKSLTITSGGRPQTGPPCETGLAEPRFGVRHNSGCHAHGSLVPRAAPASAPICLGSPERLRYVGGSPGNLEAAVGVLSLHSGRCCKLRHLGIHFTVRDLTAQLPLRLCGRQRDSSRVSDTDKASTSRLARAGRGLGVVSMDER